MTRKSYTANARKIPNQQCPCCDQNIKSGMPIYYVPNIFGTMVVDSHGYTAKTVVIHKSCEGVYNLS
jgi:hypothetical protein